MFKPFSFSPCTKTIQKNEIWSRYVTFGFTSAKNSAQLFVYKNIIKTLCPNVPWNLQSCRTTLLAARFPAAFLGRDLKLNTKGLKSLRLNTCNTHAHPTSSETKFHSVKNDSVICGFGTFSWSHSVFTLCDCCVLSGSAGWNFHTIWAPLHKTYH